MWSYVEGMSTPNIWKEIENQALWILEHGSTRAGYIARYGAANDPNKYGNGGEAIYAADAGYLAKLIDVVAKRKKKGWD